MQEWQQYGFSGIFILGIVALWIRDAKNDKANREERKKKDEVIAEQFKSIFESKTESDNIIREHTNELAAWRQIFQRNSRN